VRGDRNQWLRKSGSPEALTFPNRGVCLWLNHILSDERPESCSQTSVLMRQSTYRIIARKYLMSHHEEQTNCSQNIPERRKAMQTKPRGIHVSHISRIPPSAFPGRAKPVFLLFALPMTIWCTVNCTSPARQDHRHSEKVEKESFH
jgi:hypothetical protein